MERESFEDEEVAHVLNEHFVSIKVDREERPDIDSIYMSVTQALTGSGGWPMTVFLTPDKEPFFAGTYFPKQDRMGIAGLMRILSLVDNAWKTNRNSLLESSNQIMRVINQPQYTSSGELSDDIIHEAFEDFKEDFDPEYGGFGRVPKFPTPHNLFFLLRYWYNTKDPYALQMVEKTLDAMHRGGIYDHIGFGFSRYSTDRKWLVPHFEKMLYDNALLAIAYLETYQATKNGKYATVANQIFTYILRDMTSPEGAFYSAEDADSEGEEGKFYVWKKEEVLRILGDEAGKRFCSLLDLTPHGNFEGANIPNLIKTSFPENEKGFIEECRQKLFEVREKRIHPYKDDKILTAWNGLMIAAMAIGSKVLGDPQYSQAAGRAVDFIFSKLIHEDGRLLARYREGHSAFPAYVDDYAFLVWGLIELYEATYDPQYLDKALKLNNDLIHYFWDQEEGGFFLYGNDSEQLITRPKEIYDGATPSGNSVATFNLLRLARLTGKHELEEMAVRQFKTFGGNLERAPRGHAFLLTALLFSQSGTKEIVLVDDNYQQLDPMLKILREDFRPFTVSMLYSDQHKDLGILAPFLKDYKAVQGKTTAYVCENFACQTPVTDETQLRDLLSH